MSNRRAGGEAVTIGTFGTYYNGKPVKCSFCGSNVVVGIDEKSATVCCPLCGKYELIFKEKNDD